MQVTADKLVAI